MGDPTPSAPRPPLKIGAERFGVTTKLVLECSNGNRVVISQGDVTQFSGDAIVNAANAPCLGGGGVDGAISGKGGDALYQERKALPVIYRDGSDVRCPCGDAKLTGPFKLGENGYRLPA